ncbi:CLUMA_CG001229, isoform A [Clunio marinus]|uniref:CLUMA_CG001229, isoform A n=1 Tax=Clunio marinus TaxID=568069 RepID=A0A1J1HHR0_9DIPT|nr:CLUMA_CG001229, isoform A [Clunio marinus]
MLIDKMDVTYNESFVIYEQLVEKTPDESTILNFNVTFVVPIEKLFMQFSLFIQKPNGAYESVIKTGAMNLCGFLKNQKGNKILRMIFNGDSVNRKFPKTCPIDPGLYFFHNFKLDEDLVPQVQIFREKFKIDIHFTTKIDGTLTEFIKLKINGEIKDRIKWQEEREKEMKKNKKMESGN